VHAIATATTPLRETATAYGGYPTGLERVRYGPLLYGGAQTGTACEPCAP
jgi:hypothetical protein